VAEEELWSCLCPMWPLLLLPGGCTPGLDFFANDNTKSPIVMSTEGPKLSPRKGRWPKDEKKRAIRRRQLEVATQYKKAKKRQDGSSGPASKTRHIDPASEEGRRIIALLSDPHR
jgi:hypothetical protein